MRLTTAQIQLFRDQWYPPLQDMVHQSFLNRTDGVKWPSDLRYQSAALPPHGSPPSLPNKSEPALEMGVPAICDSPGQDFSVWSQSHPYEVTCAYNQFLHSRASSTRQQLTNRFNVKWTERKVSKI